MGNQIKVGDKVAFKGWNGRPIRCVVDRLIPRDQMDPIACDGQDDDLFAAVTCTSTGIDLFVAVSLLKPVIPKGPTT